ncbi:unnamed protein product, partial [Meganyctiphanes norvegica]
DNLPSRVRLPLVEKLEETNEDFKFTKNLFEKQFSRTMNLLDDNKKSPTASMYTSQVVSSNSGKASMNEAYPDSSNKASTPTNQGSSDSQTGNSPQGGSHHLGGRGRGCGRGGGWSSQYYRDKPPCTLCYPLRHSPQECRYKTPEEKRKRLVDINRCQACTTLIGEHGRDCSHRARCSAHPNERHVYWTCDQVSHPGPQCKFTIQTST